MTPTGPWGKDQGGMSAESRSPGFSLVRSSHITSSVQGSVLVSLPLSKGFPNTQLRESLCNVFWSPRMKGLLLTHSHLWQVTSSHSLAPLVQWHNYMLSANLLREHYQKAQSFFMNFSEYDIWSSGIPQCRLFCTAGSFPRDFGDTEPCGDQWLNRSKYLNTQVKCSHLFHKVMSGSQTGVTGGGKEEPEEAGISLLISKGREELSEENIQETSEPLGELRRLRVEGVVEKGIR